MKVFGRSLSSTQTPFTCSVKTKTLSYLPCRSSGQHYYLCFIIFSSFSLRALKPWECQRRQIRVSVLGLARRGLHFFSDTIRITNLSLAPTIFLHAPDQNMASDWSSSAKAAREVQPLQFVGSMLIKNNCIHW